jgi:O-antigen ligase
MTSTAVTYPLRAAWRRSGVLRGIATVFAIALPTIVVLAFADPEWNLFQFLLGCAVFLGALCLARPLSGRAHAGERESFLLGTLVIWVFLMVSESMFSHSQSTASTAKGHVDTGAFFQALSWILSFGALAFITCFRPAYVRRLFSGPLKWASIFVVVAVLSCPLSPKPSYSLALAFKLGIIVLTLCAMGEAIENETGIRRLYVGLFLGSLVIVSKAFITALLQPDPFKGGRLPMIGLSGAAGVLLLLCLLFLFLKKNLLFLLFGAYAVVVMVLAGNKGGMVASFASVLMFFLLLKKPAQAIAVSVGLGVILILAMAFTSLGESLQRYSQEGNASTLSGRTNLWTDAWPNIKEHPLFGKGYRASRFLSEEVPGAFQEAGNMHNSFLEVLYNNGIAGLIPIVVINLLIVVNLKRVIVRPPSVQLRYYAAAALALQVHLFVWGLVAVTFGGAPDDRFMLFFAILLISMFLRSQCDQKYRNSVYAELSS